VSGGAAGRLGTKRFLMSSTTLSSGKLRKGGCNVAHVVFDLENDSSLKQKLVRSLERSTRLRRAKTLAATHNALSGSHSLAQIIFDLGQGLLGALLLFVGIVLTLTLWLMPAGVPLALLGCALMATAGDKV
jgi:predicted RND superfamily exporter protein